MNPNPYEAPQLVELIEERAPGETNAVLALLTEIRDGQRELLDLHRQALSRTRIFGRFGIVSAIVPFLILAWALYRIINLPTPPARPVIAPRAAPPAPAPVRTFVQPLDKSG